MKRSRVLTGAIALAAMLGISPSAEAATITGGITFSGQWAPDGGTVATTDGINVLGDQSLVTCAAFPLGVGSCTGSYATLNNNFITATYNDFTFDPLGGSTNPLWTFAFGGNTYSFSLASLAIVSQTTTAIVLNGSGILSITGFDDTPGSWSFSGDSTGGIFAFSATNAAEVVPEPAAVLLLGLGLLGGARAARRRLVS